MSMRNIPKMPSIRLARLGLYITFVRVKSGMGGEFLNDIVPARKKLMSEAMKSGLVLSHKILHGFALNGDDWDFMMMVEYRNWAALDGLKQKLDEINRRCVGKESEVIKIIEKRETFRTIIGDKVVQEIIPN